MLSPGGALSFSVGQPQSHPSIKHQQPAHCPLTTFQHGTSGTACYPLLQAGLAFITRLARIRTQQRAMHLPFTSRQPEVPILIVTPSTPREMSAGEKPLLPAYPNPFDEKIKRDEEEELLYEAPRPSNARRFILLALFITSLIFLTLLVTCHPSMPTISGVRVKRNNSHAGLKVRLRLNIGVRNGGRQHARDFEVPETKQKPMADFSTWLADAVGDERAI